MRNSFHSSFPPTNSPPAVRPAIKDEENPVKRKKLCKTIFRYKRKIFSDYWGKWEINF